MNYLKEMLEARGMTPIELAKLCDLPITTIRYTLTDDRISTARKSTQKIIADALGVTVAELTKGGKSMKDKILKAEVKTAVERLALTLRKYSSEPHYLSIAIFTQNKDARAEDFPGETPDSYVYNVQVANKAETRSELPFIPIMSEDGRIFYTTDEGTEGIRIVVPYERGEKGT